MRRFVLIVLFVCLLAELSWILTRSEPAQPAAEKPAHLVAVSPAAGHLVHMLDKWGAAQYIPIEMVKLNKEWTGQSATIEGIVSTVSVSSTGYTVYMIKTDSKNSSSHVSIGFAQATLPHSVTEENIKGFVVEVTGIVEAVDSLGIRLYGKQFINWHKKEVSP